MDVARNYNNLADIYQDLGDLEQAKEYQQLALRTALDKLGLNMLMLQQTTITWLIVTRT